MSSLSRASSLAMRSGVDGWVRKRLTIIPCLLPKGLEIHMLS